jgi:ankyrin repeat protein
VLLQFVDPNMLSGNEYDVLQVGEIKGTPLHHLACLADPSDYSAHKNQVTLGRQLIEHGVKNVNAAAHPAGETPLHCACHTETPTNLDFIQLLLDNGADPNIPDYKGETPLMCTLRMAPGAAKFLLELPITDVNIISKSGASFQALVRGAVEHFSDKVALPDIADKAKHQFLLQQWRGIEEMLAERQAVDTGTTAVE